jgi:hypothetical protein
MTQGGIDKLLHADQMKKRVLLEGGSVVQSPYRYLDLPAWMEIDAMPWSTDQLRQLRTIDAQRDWLLNWLSEHVKLQTAIDGDQETAFRTKLRSILVASYDLRTEQDGSLYGVTNAGQQRKVSVEIQRATETYLELVAEQLAEHLVVCWEHAQGLVEVLYEGPIEHALVGLGSIRMKAGGPIRIVAREMRARNCQVPYEDRLRDKVV